MNFEQFEADINKSQGVEGWEYRQVKAAPFEWWDALDTLLGPELMYLSETIDYVNYVIEAEVLISPAGLQKLLYAMTDEVLEKLEQEQTDAI